MPKGEITLASEYSSVWDELNKARTRLGVYAMSVPNVKNLPATSEQMNKMEDDINATRTSDIRISRIYTQPVVLSNIDVGDIMLYNVLSDAVNIAQQYQGVPVCSCEGHQSDYGNDCTANLWQCGCWGDSGCDGDDGGCKENCDCHGTCDTY